MSFSEPSWRDVRHVMITDRWKRKHLQEIALSAGQPTYLAPTYVWTNASSSAELAGSAVPRVTVLARVLLDERLAFTTTTIADASGDWRVAVPVLAQGASSMRLVVEEWRQTTLLAVRAQTMAMAPGGDASVVAREVATNHARSPALVALGPLFARAWERIRLLAPIPSVATSLAVASGVSTTARMGPAVHMPAPGAPSVSRSPVAPAGRRSAGLLLFKLFAYVWLRLRI